MPKIPPINYTESLPKKLARLKGDSSYSMLLGDFKGFKTAHREYAKLAVDNFELAASIEPPVKGKISLFSKLGLNVLKCMFLNLFSKKTPEEKQLIKMGKKFKLEQKAKALMNK